MNYHGYRNQAGALVGIMQTPGLPTEAEKTAEVSKLTTAYGGTWQWVELTLSQFNTALGIYRQNKAAVIVGGEVTAAGPPEISTDKMQILANGNDTATITFDVNDANYSGAGRYWINPPEANSPQVNGNLIFTGGVASKTLATNQVGIHQIECDVIGYGRAEITVEGVM